MKPSTTSLFQPHHILGKGVVFQNTNGLQQVNTKYNIRGWLTQINDINTLGNDLFAFQINYNNPDTNYQGTALYNGNISQTHWRSQNNNTINRYGYSYDGLNRLLHADYTSGTSVNSNGRYNETLQYDKNGNITKLNRRGSHNIFNELIDQLSYSYIGNQLQNVTDSTIANEAAGFIDGNIGTATNPDYNYDSFGNMIVDKNKKITAIKYNHLNLPLEIVFNNNSQTKINYTYNALGIKVLKNVNDNLQYSTTEYLGGYQYNNGVLQFFPQAQGYVKHNVNPNTTASEFDYVYQYKDHLGNIRINYTFDTATSSLRVLEENHYYPFGLKHQENLQPRSIRFAPSPIITNEWIKGVGYLEPMPVAALVPNSGYQYKYNGKEYQDELGLNVYDYGARNYDLALGRWMNVDALSEVYYPISSYIYALNNPMYFVDPDGNYIQIYYKHGNRTLDERYEYKENRDYSKISNNTLRETYMALDALYNASNIVLDDGSSVNIMETLMKSEKELSIAERPLASNFEGGRDYREFDKTGKYKENSNEVIGTIFWDRKTGVAFNDTIDVTHPDDVLNKDGSPKIGTKINSPTSLLGHELVHGFNFLSNKNEHRNNRESGPVIFGKIKFKNQEEAKTTTLSAQININLSENPRLSHVGYDIRTSGVLTNSPINIK